MNPWPLIMAGFRRGLGTSLGLILLIALAVALSIGIGAGERSIRKGIAQAGDAFDLLIAAPGSAAQLVLSVVYLRPAPLELIPGQTLAKLKADPGIIFATPIGFGDFYQGHALVGTSPEMIGPSRMFHLEQGLIFDRFDQVIIGANVNLDLGFQFHPHHGLHGDIDADDDHGPEHKGLTLTIVGRLAPTGTPWDNAILLPIETIWWVHSLPTGHLDPDPDQWTINGQFDGEPGAVPAIVVKPKAIGDAYRLRKAYRTNATNAVFTGEVLAELFSTLGDVRAILSAVALAVQVMVLAAVLLAAFAALEQRQRTLGVLRALGASRGFIFSVLWGHIGILVSTGALLGLGFGLAMTAGLGAYLRATSGVAVPMAISLADIELALALPVLAIIIASIPAWRSCLRPVSESLR